MAAVIEVCTLGKELLMLCTGRLSYACFSESVLKVLAGEAHHEGAAGPEST